MYKPLSALLWLAVSKTFCFSHSKVKQLLFHFQIFTTFLSYNPIFHRWQHLYQALMWAIVVVTIVYNKKKIFFCGKVYIVMYFFVSIRFHIRYF